MNPKLFYIIKALDKFPEEIKIYIFDLIKKFSADFICEKLSDSYYDKTNKNCVIYITIYKLNRSYTLPETLYIKRFLLYTKNNITYKYIQDHHAWVNEMIELFYSYYNNHVISGYILDLINNILDKF